MVIFQRRSFEDTQELKEHKNFHYVIDSMMNKLIVVGLVDMAVIIFHLAASVSVMLIIESPVGTIETNTKGTEIVLELAAKK